MCVRVCVCECVGVSVLLVLLHEDLQQVLIEKEIVRVEKETIKLEAETKKIELEQIKLRLQIQLLQQQIRPQTIIFEDQPWPSLYKHVNKYFRVRG